MRNLVARAVLLAASCGITQASVIFTLRNNDLRQPGISRPFGAIPEPAIYTLIGSGMLLVGLARKKFSRRR